MTRHGPLDALVPGAVQDFAFADTVILGGDLEEPIPPSSGIVVHGDEGDHAMMPVMHPPLSSRPPPPAPLAMQGFWPHVRRAMDELSLLWSATATLEEAHDGAGAVIPEEDPFARAATMGRRVRTLFSFFEWDRSDVLRATWIGLAVFVLAATVGAIVLQVGS